ncbi:CARDB domain-containing protein [Sulfurospirillum sp. 1612]|uniref:CARDB domain-containing protein n=1 Tax=Sulfurospirillum sp. 1612 TaxID=3094835 RepID=UPI002F95153E
MMKNIVFMMLLLFVMPSFADSQYDKDIVVLDQSRDDKVKEVFKQLMGYYEEQDSQGFFSLVSEDRFIQDYMIFSEAIEKDFRTYDILSFDYWVDKITSDGIKRYLYVKWDKRYEVTNGTTQIKKVGYSRFLFDEINGQYKLIELAGNNLWGESLGEWTRDVPKIAGQEVYQTASGAPAAAGGALPDLTVTIIDASVSEVYFKIMNIGAGTAIAPITYRISYCGNNATYNYDGNLAPGETQTLSKPMPAYVCPSSSPITITIDPSDNIIESDEFNNEESATL